MSLFVDPVPDVSPESRIKEIRQAMLDCLAGLDEGRPVVRVMAKVLYASDIQSLWYLRSDVMGLLSNMQGESAAQEQILSITDMFTGLLPAAQKPRPNRLSK